MDSDDEKYFLGIHESLLCIHTVLSILSGAFDESAAMGSGLNEFFDHFLFT